MESKTEPAEALLQHPCKRRAPKPSGTERPWRQHWTKPRPENTAESLDIRVTWGSKVTHCTTGLCRTTALHRILEPPPGLSEVRRQSNGSQLHLTEVEPLGIRRSFPRVRTTRLNLTHAATVTVLVEEERRGADGVPPSRNFSPTYGALRNIPRRNLPLVMSPRYHELPEELPDLSGACNQATSHERWCLSAREILASTANLSRTSL